MTSGSRAPATTVDLSVELAGLRLTHPILNGSGTFDVIAARRVFGDELIERFPFAAFVSKTVTLEPREGNRPPRIWEIPAGMINSIGLPNPGLAGFLERDLPELAAVPGPLIVSVAGFSHDEFARLVAEIAERPEVSALELNVSCPNVTSGCTVGSDARETAILMDRLRPITAKPLIVKLTPDAPDPGAVAEAAASGGADALSLINTLRAAAVAPEAGDGRLGTGGGGLSGPAIRAVALEMTREVASRTRLPLIGMGGVQRGRDALRLIEAGAVCVAVGTESFRDPAAGTRIRGELTRLLGEAGLRSVREAVGGGGGAV